MPNYHIRIDDLTLARGSDARFAWAGQSAEDLAVAVTAALRQSGFAQDWRDQQAEPDEVAADLLVIDASALVGIEHKAQRVEMTVTTTLPHRVLAHRLNLLIGTHWSLRDVS